MATVTIEIDDEVERRLRAVATAERVSTEEVFREALDGFLRSSDHPALGVRPDRHAALREMIGLVQDGPVDASAQHDRRTGGGP